MPDVFPITDDWILTGNNGTIDLEQDHFKFGGFDLSCNGINAGTLIIRDKSVAGTILVKTSSLTGKVSFAPIKCSGTIYYDISGTGASVFLYGWK